MKRTLYLTLLCCLLTACATHFPVQGKTSKGELFNGEAIASISDGSFEIASQSGTHCHGKYDQFSTEPTLALYVTCSDGRHGRIMAQRDSSLTSGTGTGTMSDGTEFTFTFGNRVKNQL